MAFRRRRSKLSRSVRLIAGSSVLIGLVLTGAGVAQSFSNLASASPSGVGQQLASDTGGMSEYSICAGVASSATCSFRGQPSATEVQGAMAVDGNFSGFNFYFGDMLTNTVVLAAAGNISGSLAVIGAGNSGVYGGSDYAHVPADYCTPSPCSLPESNLVPASTNNPLPNFSAINAALTSESATLGALTSTAGTTIAPSLPTLVLTGTNTQENVFDLAPGELAATSNLYVNVPPGSSTVINVPDTSVNCSGTACLQIAYYWDGSVYEAGNASPGPTVQALEANTVLNFPNATSVDLNSAGPSLNILAPYADFTFINGNIIGYVYANQVNGTFENELPWSGGVPTTTTTTTTPICTTSSSTTTSTTGSTGSSSTTSTTGSSGASSTTTTTAPICTSTTTTIPICTSSTTTSSTTSTTGSTSSSSTTSTTSSTGSSSTTTTTAPTCTTITTGSTGSSGTTSTTVVVPNTPGTVGTTTTTTLPTTTTVPTTSALATTTTTTIAPTTTTVATSTSTTVRTHARSVTTTTAPAATTTTAPAATTTIAPAATTTTAPAVTTTIVRTHAHSGTTSTVPVVSTTVVHVVPTTTAPLVTTTAVRGVTSTTATSPTTAPSTTAPTTTAPTTTAPASTTTTAPTTTTTTPGTLAYTGSDSSRMLGFGLALILLGGGVVAFSYRRRPLV